MKLLSVAVLLIFNNAVSEGSGLKGKPQPFLNPFLSEKDSVPDIGNFPEVEYPQSVPLQLQSIPFYYKANGDLDPFSEDVQATFKSITEQTRKIKEDLTPIKTIDDSISPTNCKENKVIVKDVNIQEVNSNDSVNEQFTNRQDANESYFENNTFNKTGIVSNFKIDGKNKEDAAQIFEDNFADENNATTKKISENMDWISLVDSVYQNPGTETDIQETNVSCSDNDEEQVKAILEINLNENNNTDHSNLIKEAKYETQVEKPLVLDDTEILVRKKRALTSSESAGETYVQEKIINKGEEKGEATDEIINNSFDLNNMTTEYNNSIVNEEHENEVNEPVMINNTVCLTRAKRSFSSSEAGYESDVKIEGLRIDDEENQPKAKVMDDSITTNDKSCIEEEFETLANNSSMFNSNETLVRKERSFTSARTVSEINEQDGNLGRENEHAEASIAESFNNITASDHLILEEEFEAQAENPLEFNDTETLDRKRRSILSTESVSITDLMEENVCDIEKEAEALIVDSGKMNMTASDTSNIEENSYESQAENPSIFNNTASLNRKKRSVTSSESVSETDLINSSSNDEATAFSLDNNLNDNINTTSDNSNMNHKFETEAQNIPKLNNTGCFIRRKRSTVSSELTSIEEEIIQDNLMQDSGATTARGFNSAETVLPRPPLTKDNDDGISIEDHNGSIEYLPNAANCDENGAIDQRPNVDEDIKDL